MRHVKDYETSIFKINRNCSTKTALVALENLLQPLAVIAYEHNEIWFVGKPCELNEFEWLSKHLLRLVFRLFNCYAFNSNNSF